MHQLCCHYWEIFVLTEGNPIAKYSEQGSEAWNKYIRVYQRGPGCRAKLMNSNVNI